MFQENSGLKLTLKLAEITSIPISREVLYLSLFSFFFLVCVCQIKTLFTQIHTIEQFQVSSQVQHFPTQ